MEKYDLFSVYITHKKIKQHLLSKTIDKQKLNSDKGSEGIYADDITLPLEIFKELINKHKNEPLNTRSQDPDSQKICFIVDKQNKNIQISPEDFDTISNMCNQNNNNQTTEPQTSQGYRNTKSQLQNLRADPILKKHGLTPPILFRHVAPPLNSQDDQSKTTLSTASNL